MARLLNQIYIVPVPPPGYNYDNLHANVMNELTPSTLAGATASHLHFHSQHECIFYIYTVMQYDFIYIYEIISYISYVLSNYECNLTAWS